MCVCFTLPPYCCLTFVTHSDDKMRMPLNRKSRRQSDRLSIPRARFCIDKSAYHRSGLEVAYAAANGFQNFDPHKSQCTPGRELDRINEVEMSVGTRPPWLKVSTLAANRA